MGTTPEEQLVRYDGVIHLRTLQDTGYDHSNPLRLEPSTEAAALDSRILQAWAGHPNRSVVSEDPDFMVKAHKHWRRCERSFPTAAVGICSRVGL